MRNPIKVCVPWFAGFITCVLLAGCAAGGSSSNSLSGKVIDMASGQPIAGATIAFASYSTSSGSDGSFNLTYSSSSGTETGTLQAGKAGYSGIYWDGIVCDRSKNTSVTIPLNPVSTTGYPVQTVTGRIYDATHTELAGTPTVTFQVLTKTGARYSHSVTYAPGSGYSIATPAFGTDCLIAATVSGSFTVIVGNVDLSGAPKAIDLTEDAVHTTSVGVTASALNYSGAFWFQSPYGAFSVWQYTFSGSATTTVDIPNPYGYEGFWVQQFQSNNTPSVGYTKTWSSCSAVGPVSSSVVLPSLNMALGPTTGSNSALFAYSAGTLTVPVASGATAYQFTLREDIASPTCGAFVISMTPTVVLPSWIRDQFSGKNIQVNLWAVDSVVLQNVGLDTVMGAMGTNGCFPGAQYATVGGPSASLPF